MEEVCALCGEQESAPGIEVCSVCASDSRLMGRSGSFFAPEAQERMAHESGEMMSGFRGDGL